MPETLLIKADGFQSGLLALLLFDDQDAQSHGEVDRAGPVPSINSYFNTSNIDPHAFRRAEDWTTAAEASRPAHRMKNGARGRRRSRGANAHAEKLEPQPQVLVAFGFLMTNWAPCRSSL